MRTEYNGTMGLLKIKKIVPQNIGSNKIFHICFDNNRILIVVALECFLTKNNEAKRIDELKSDDEIWIILNHLL